MKLDNKGFAISTIMYVILMMAILLIVSTLFILGNRKIIIDKQKNEILDNIYGEDNNKVYIDASGANAPELMDTLTPVVYDDETSKWKVVDKTDSNWYSYNEQKWANAVIVKEGVSKDVGTLLTVPSTQEEITSSDILAMFVWIPRYEYKIDTTDGQFGKGSTNKSLPGEIEVNFISKSQDKATEGYIIHPGFTFGSDTLSGIWVGKFETSHTSGTFNLTCIDETCDDVDDTRILPNVTSLRSNKVSKIFFATRSMSKEGNIFKIDKSKTDTHMMKNVEWGAVAYLSQSKYGKYGNDKYMDDNKEVYKNDSSSYITGKSSGKPSKNDNTADGTYSYNEDINGTGASTTGNIYGVYDMNGGALEYVMGNSNDIIGDSGFDAIWFANNTKYYDKYANSCSDDECKGHALGETEEWYSDKAVFVESSAPWLLRGGAYSGTSNVGVFYFSNGSGGNSSYNSFRVVIAPTTVA